ncbi:hypothetical protein TRVL_06286 [Trypanosoma vivax]|nr:hypothetical protein TRVL_06286 [Trypanosoma vivax]
MAVGLLSASPVSGTTPCCGVSRYFSAGGRSNALCHANVQMSRRILCSILAAVLRMWTCCGTVSCLFLERRYGRMHEAPLLRYSECFSFSCVCTSAFVHKTSARWRALWYGIRTARIALIVPPSLAPLGLRRARPRWRTLRKRTRIASAPINR